MSVNDLISAYSDAATLVGFYWHFYAIVVFGLVGYLLGRDDPLKPSLRYVMLIGFWLFAFASFGALVNKHGLHFAFAHEIQERLPSANFGGVLEEKLSICCGIFQPIFPSSCLHATNPIIPAALHIVIDVLVTFVILKARK